MLERASRSFSSSHTSRLGIEWPLRDPGWRSTFFFFFDSSPPDGLLYLYYPLISSIFSLFHRSSSSHPHSLRSITLPGPLFWILSPIPILKSNPLPITAHQHVSGPIFDPAWQFQRNIGLRRHRSWAGPDFPSRPLGGSSVIPVTHFCLSGA